MVAFAVGMTAAFYAKGIRPEYAAGLSLGEYSALNAAGVLDAATTVELVAFRGKAMAKAAEGIECGMTAVMMLDRDKLQACCDEAAGLGVVQICNYNLPRPAGHRRREGRCGQGRRAGQGGRRQALHPPQGQRPPSTPA